jgi:amino acid transporter/polyhydroxyalkanoate synthesis regulator phasin
MFFKQLFAKKSLETLLEEMAGENRLRRVLGPIGLTSLGVGAIIGAGIFVMTGRAAAQDAGPAIVLSYCVAGLGCLFAALCYAEFASTAPVAGSAYTYAYATLGELLAWIIGWDLILEYAMACACVAASWSKYFNEFTRYFFNTQVPPYLCNDPFTHDAFFNLPAVVIILFCTIILVIGIRESATTNAILVGIKLVVVIFVIVVGSMYVQRAFWTTIPPSERLLPEDRLIPAVVERQVKEGILNPEEAKRRIQAIVNEVQVLAEAPKGAATNQAAADRIKQQIEALYGETARMPEAEAAARVKKVTGQVLALRKVELHRAGQLGEPELKTELAAIRSKYGVGVPETPEDIAIADKILATVREEVPLANKEKWGLLGLFGLDQWLTSIDDSVRSPFAPYGLSGIMLGAAIVFFAYIGFDSISTHAEEARRPARDVPVGILASLILCTILYIGVAAVITGMVPYPSIDADAAVAAAFRQVGERDNSATLKAAGGFIAIGALAGMTSVLLITFLSQARIFLAMARDRLLPPSVFGAVHHRFRTPHLSTMFTGGLMAVVAALTPILKLEEMVNIGTLMAFVIVCAAVLILRIQRPDAHRPFRCPAVYLVAPLGIVVNLIMMLFLPWDTWLRLVVWLVVGLVIYLLYGSRHSTIGKHLRTQLALEGASPTNSPFSTVDQTREERYKDPSA